MKKGMSWPFLLTVFVLLFGFHSSEAQDGPIPKKVIKIDSQAPDAVTDDSIPDISEIFLEEGDYYLVRGRKVYLRRDAHRMVIKFKKQPFAALASYGLRSEEQDAALQSTLNVPASEMAVSVEHQFNKRRISIIRTRPKEGEKLLRSQIQDFNNRPSVEYAHPLFIAEKGMGKLVLILLFLLSACYTQKETVTFPTPFGEIEKGYSMVEVMGVLGNPDHVTSSERKEVWSYYFENNQRIFVYFKADKVTRVVSREGLIEDEE